MNQPSERQSVVAELPNEYIGEEGAPRVQVHLPPWVAAVERGLIMAAGLILISCMLMTVTDVAGRYLLNRPLGFAYEVTELMMGIVVFVAMGSVTLRKEHITVTLFEKVWGNGTIKAVRDILVAFVVAAAFGYFSYRMFIFVGRFRLYNDITSVLHVPLWPFALVGALGSSFATLAAFALAVRAALSIFRK